MDDLIVTIYTVTVTRATDGTLYNVLGDVMPVLDVLAESFNDDLVDETDALGALAFAAALRWANGYYSTSEGRLDSLPDYCFDAWDDVSFDTFAEFKRYMTHTDDEYWGATAIRESE
jgi:hypothetical protein